MNKTRPVNLDLTKFHFPPMAIVSILHRVTGVLLFLSLPVLIYWLQQSLGSIADFQALLVLLKTSGMRFLVWLVVCISLFHLIAGIRHLLMDLGIGESVVAGHVTAYAVFLISIVLFVLVGVWLC